MSLELKILIGVWLYLSAGIGTVLFSQVIAAKMEGTDYDDWCDYLKIDPDYEEFGVVVLGCIMFWPFLFLFALYLLIERGLRKVFKMDAQENDLDRKFYSVDALPTNGVPNGYVIQMEDTKDIFIFDAERQTWIQHMPLEQDEVK